MTDPIPREWRDADPGRDRRSRALAEEVDLPLKWERAAVGDDLTDVARDELYERVHQASFRGATQGFVFRYDRRWSFRASHVGLGAERGMARRPDVDLQADSETEALENGRQLVAWNLAREG